MHYKGRVKPKQGQCLAQQSFDSLLKTLVFNDFDNNDGMQLCISTSAGNSNLKKQIIQNQYKDFSQQEIVLQIPLAAYSFAIEIFQQNLLTVLKKACSNSKLLFQRKPLQVFCKKRFSQRLFTGKTYVGVKLQAFRSY